MIDSYCCLYLDFYSDLLISMGNQLGCCTNLNDQSNFKEFCMANSSPQYLPYLTEVINISPETTQDQIRGDWKEGEPKTGRGIIFSPMKFYYEGDIVESKANGKGKILWQTKTIYEGNLLNNQANGQGTIKFPQDETTIRGEWLQGEPRLNSKLQFFSSVKGQRLSITIFEIRKSAKKGERDEDLESFVGKIEFQGGSIYEGEFKRKKDNQYRIQGRGTLRFVDGSEYSGQFENGKMHGKGKYKWASSGHWFEGEYKSNFRDGPGTYYYNEKNSKTGIWKGGHLDTQGQPQQ